MRKQIILKLGSVGSFEQGFPVTLRIKDSSTHYETENEGMLPPAPKILQELNTWQSAYNQWKSANRIRPNPDQVTNFSNRDVKLLGLPLAECLNEWLNSDFEEWKKLREELLTNLSQTDKIQFLIQTKDVQIQQLPWHSWNLFSERFKKVEPTFIPLQYEQLQTPMFTKKVRILAILGNTTGINVNEDRNILLKQLPPAKISFLIEPQRQDLNDQLWNQQPDILFFAGHSGRQVNSNNDVIYINQNDSLTINELKHGLRRVTEKGLQLVILNSCDGLGLAQELAKLNIPQIIVMRMPVPDFIAQKFLQYFLIAFARGIPLDLAVREAREQLQGWENQYPRASWLPVIYQNPNTEPLTWQDLARRPRHQRWLPTLKTALTLGLSSVLLVNELSASTEVLVSAKSDPWLAGMPPKSKANSCLIPNNPPYISKSPDNSPPEVKFEKRSLKPGSYLTFTTEHKINTRYDKQSFNDADGNKGNQKETPSGKGDNGISSIKAPNGALVGVFIGEEQKNEFQAPDPLSFKKVEEQNYLKLFPKLKQVFFIGDGKTDRGRQQRVVVPIGAKHLYLGIMDHCHWDDNQEDFNVKVTIDLLSL